MKKQAIIYGVMGFLLFAAGFFANISRIFAYDFAPASIALAPDATSVGAGYIQSKTDDSVYASLTVDPGDAQLCDFSANISYDSSKLSLASITDYSDNFTNIVKNSAVAGTITYSADRIGGCADIDGTVKLFTAIFKVNGIQGDYAQLKIESMDLSGDPPNPGVGSMSTVEVISSKIQPPEVLPTNTNTNSGGSWSGSGSVVPHETVPTAQNGVVNTSGSVLPVTGINESGSVKVPVLKSAYFSANYEENNSTCKGLILSGTAEPNSKVHLIIDESKLEYTANASNGGDWTININDAMPEGKYNLTMYSAIKDLVSANGKGKFVFKIPCKENVAVGSELPTSLKGRLHNMFSSRVFSVVAYGLVLLLILGGTLFYVRKKRIIK